MYVYVFTSVWQMDSGECGHDCEVYADVADAFQRLEDEIKQAREDFSSLVTEESDYTKGDMSYSIWEQDNYCYNHIDLAIWEKAVK